MSSSIPQELRQYRPKIPVICVGNKIDIDYSVTQKSFGFPKKNDMNFYFVSASDGTNVVKVHERKYAWVCDRERERERREREREAHVSVALTVVP